MADKSPIKSFFHHPPDFAGRFPACPDNTGNLFDDLSYSYTPGTNRLIKVSDSAPFDGTHDDIEDQTATTNYTYDASGNMIGDAAEGLTIAWNYLGKVDKVTKANNNEILFRYDGMGQRVVKIDRPAQGSHETQTIYIRDASGNVMAVYEYIVQKPDAVFDPNAFMEYRLEELHIYGSSRLGLLLTDKLLESNGMLYRSMPATLGEYNHWIAGNKRYELTNHLGNVLSVVSDRKIGFGQFNTLYFSYYMPDIRSASDYYPFGWAMPGKQVVGEYRYGFNGQEKDDEVKGDGNSYDFGARMYDPRVGRWLSLDASYQSYPAVSPFAFALNSPLLFKDPDGKDAIVTVQKDPNGGGKILISTTVYITGKGANAKKALRYTQKAKELYKSGSFTNEKGEKYDIEFNVIFEYESGETEIKLKDGENILTFDNDVNFSSVEGTRKRDFDKDNNTTKITHFAGNKGTIGEGDAIGMSHQVIIHEALHFLGLSDRYENIDGKSEPDEGFENDIMGSYFGKTLNQVHFDNIGKIYSEKESGRYILKEMVDTRVSDGSLIGGSSDGERPYVDKKEKNDK